MANYRKARRFDDGGDVREGPHKGIDADASLRERALAAVRRNIERADLESLGVGDSETMAKPAAKPAARPAARPSPAPSIKPARPSYSGEMSRQQLEEINRSSDEDMLRRARKDAIEPVAPEMMLPSGRVLQGVRGLAQAAARRFAPEGEAAAAEAGKQLASRAQRVVTKDRKDMAAQRKYEERMRREPARDADEARMADEGGPNFRRGGKVKKYAAGGSVSASRRADGVAQRGKTKGRIC